MTNVPRPTVFVGSTVEGLPIAEAIQVLLERSCEIVPWTTIFDPGEFALEILESRVDDFDFAILVMTADDVVESRGNRSAAPRDNLLLELGLFIGGLGRQRTFIVMDRSVDLKLPSDLAGLTQVTFSPPENGTHRSALGAACIQVKDVVTSLGPRERVAAN